MRGDSDNQDSDAAGDSDVSTLAAPPIAGFDFLESLYPPGSSGSEKAAYVLSLLQIALLSDDEL